MTSHGSASRSVMAGTRVTTAPSADLAETRPMTMPRGAVPDSRVVWKKPDQPEDPLALGKTRILPAKQTPNSSCRGSMITPRAGSMPPHPEIGSCDTRASPSTLPGTTVLPWRMSPLILVSRRAQGSRTPQRMSSRRKASVQSSVPAAANGRVDALLERAEPGLDAEDRGQVVRLLGRVGGEHLGAAGRRAGHGRARVGQHPPAGPLDHRGVAGPGGDHLQRPGGHDPELGAGRQPLAVEQVRRPPDLVDRR